MLDICDEVRGGGCWAEQVLCASSLQAGVLTLNSHPCTAWDGWTHCLAASTLHGLVQGKQAAVASWTKLALRRVEQHSPGYDNPACVVAQQQDEAAAPVRGILAAQKVGSKLAVWA